MSERIEQLIQNNKNWAKQFEQANPGIFDKLAKQQNPDYLWIGCSDSRVPANTIVGLQPGEVFVHRNIANQVNHSDLNILSVLEYAVNVLKVTDIILCGHYGCGGVKAALEHSEHGLVDNWLRSIKDIYRINHKQFDQVNNESEQVDLLCELNAIEQVRNICRTPVVQRAWLSGQKLSVHGVIYGIENGVLKDLDVTTSSIEETETIYQLWEQK
ncbi:carbonate dehydratase [Aliikangiella coralliicola]|uniref:Carbonic anhydrase n=1 Tax=Aliikangiella coralliicola TaxID=2592383 RepID=A0A545UH36_9GAMM|nr:carbonate dehydratase [Aliikangiella coralliicola]TQV88770.1 carbonate dehydratase [Aliikangiella coralliicola]